MTNAQSILRNIGFTGISEDKNDEESDRPGEKRLVEDHFQTGRAALEPGHEGQDTFEALKRRADEWETTFLPK
jgi:hypothetical protein